MDAREDEIKMGVVGSEGDSLPVRDVRHELSTISTCDEEMSDFLKTGGVVHVLPGRWIFRRRARPV